MCLRRLRPRVGTDKLNRLHTYRFDHQREHVKSVPGEEPNVGDAPFRHVVGQHGQPVFMGLNAEHVGFWMVVSEGQRGGPGAETDIDNERRRSAKLHGKVDRPQRCLDAQPRDKNGQGMLFLRSPPASSNGKTARTPIS